MHGEFELLKAQIARRYGRAPETNREMASALELCDADLVARVAGVLEIRKALQRPMLDFRGFGGRRDAAQSAVPVGGASDEDAVDRAGEALAVLSGRVLATSRAGVEAARGDTDFRRGRRSGGMFTKAHGSIAARLAGDLQAIVDALNAPVDY